MRNRYIVEMTDTFGNEANYCWIHRFIVTASTHRGAMRKVAKKTGFAVRNVGCDRWDAVGACVCYFVECIDAADIQTYQDNYSRIEVL